MGDFIDDTALEEIDEGRYRAKLVPEWSTWGPLGGYVAAIARSHFAASFPLPGGPEGIDITSSSRSSRKPSQ